MKTTRQAKWLRATCLILILVAVPTIAGQSVSGQYREAQKATHDLQEPECGSQRLRQTTREPKVPKSTTQGPQKTPDSPVTPTLSTAGNTQKTTELPPSIAGKKVLVIDIGGTSVKILATGETEFRRFPSGPTMTPAQMVSGVKELAKDWVYDAVSIGYPGLVLRGKVAAEPHNLAPGWIGFDFQVAFGHPVKLLNDAAMQALGSYKGGTLLLLGLGTGLGSALVVEGIVVPMELGQLSYKDSTYEDYTGIRGLERIGQEEWARHIEYLVAHLIEVFHPDDVVLGGGNVERLKKLPPGCRAGNSANAFVGGFHLWSGP